jgi:NAD(P)-dependent dehydrogenase (short-subunit alcohol dehydrogenase family)
LTARVTCGRVVQPGRFTASAICPRGGDATFCRADVSSEADAAEVVRLAASKCNRIDVLCDNAASLGNFHVLGEDSVDEWER